MSYRYCNVCGHANNSINRFCESCGSNLNGTASAAAPVPAMIRKKKSGKLKIILPVIIVVLLMTGCGVLAYNHFFADTTIDLTEGFDDKVLVLSGYNGEGTIININKDKILELQNYNDADDNEKSFLKSVDYTTNKDGEVNLSNGDMVTITATFKPEFAEKCNVKVKNDSDGKVEISIDIKRLQEKPVEEDEEYNDPDYDSEDESDSDDENYSSDESSDPYEDEKMTADDGAYYTVSDTELTASDIKGWSRTKLQMYINYIYTKHGYELGETSESAKKQKKHFTQLNWYNEEPRLYKGKSGMDKCEKMFTDTENHNKTILANRRDWLDEHK